MKLSVLVSSHRTLKRHDQAVFTIHAHPLSGPELLGGSGDDIGVRNPLFIPAIGNVTLDPFIAVALPTLVGLAVFSLIQRFRRSAGDERLQLKWFVAAAAVLAIMLPIVIPIDSAIAAVFSSLAFLFLWSAIEIAVLKYRLYGIDVVISRAVVFGSA